VKLDYAFIKPEDLEAKITPDEAEIKAAYEKNRSVTRFLKSGSSATAWSI